MSTNWLLLFGEHILAEPSTQFTKANLRQYTMKLGCYDHENYGMVVKAG